MVQIFLDTNDVMCGFPGGHTEHCSGHSLGSLILLVGLLSKLVQVHPFLSDLY